MPTAHLGEQLVHWRTTGDARILYLHGVPNSGAMWTPFLERTGGVALDLAGFGESGKRGDHDFSFAALGRFVTAFLDHLGWDSVRLCMHDWGAVGLLAAQQQPERFERLVLVDAVPFLPGYRWHWIARVWRRRALGELAMGNAFRPVLRRLGIPEADIEDVVRAFDVGTQRAVLQLYRSAPEDALERAGAHLGDITCPALVVWGEDDAYIPQRFAWTYGEALGGPTELVVTPGAGHWPWHDKPELVDTITRYLL